MESSETNRERINARWKAERQAKIDKSNRQYEELLKATEGPREVEWIPLKDFRY